MMMQLGTLRLFVEKICTRLGFGMRAKLIVLFVVIKVLPLILLALVAWRQSWILGEELKARTGEITEKAYKALSETGDIAISDAAPSLMAQSTTCPCPVWRALRTPASRPNAR